MWVLLIDRQRLLPVTHTDALFATQSQSILDDLVALLGQSSPGIPWTQNAVICDTRGARQIVKRAPGNVRYLGQFGDNMLTWSFTACDPKPTPDALRLLRHQTNSAFPFGSGARL